MRARAGLAQWWLWQCGHHEDAFARWRGMLRLEANDSQDIP